MGVNGIYGLSGSGLDIESMVKVGMLGKQSEYDQQPKHVQHVDALAIQDVRQHERPLRNEHQRRN